MSGHELAPTLEELLASVIVAADRLRARSGELSRSIGRGYLELEDVARVDRELWDVVEVLDDSDLEPLR